MGKKIKYSDNFNRDWDFYTKNLSKLSFWGGDPIFTPIYDPNGISAKEFFYKLDSTGMAKMANIGCSEPQLVADVLRFKKALNFHIKMWCEGFWDCGIGIMEYVNTFDDPPDWVETSFRNQLYKMPYVKPGWIPLPKEKTWIQRILSCEQVKRLFQCLKLSMKKFLGSSSLYLRSLLRRG